MQINLVEKSTEESLFLETEHNDPDKVIEIEYIGSKNVIGDFYRATESKYGYYGHIFDLNGTTNLDLQKVVYDLEEFTVVSVTPVIKANKLPEGTIS